jgi:uncharacterized protein YndB with AHSA1/START domain/copper chaperone CopZ
MQMDTPSKLPDIRKTRVLDEPIQRVWDVIATPEGIALWFVPNDFKPVKGHEFHVEMDAPQGKTACQVTSIDPHVRLAYDVGQDWNWTFELNDLGERTELTFIWSGWDRNKATDFGISHTTLHNQLTEGTNVLIKRLARSVRNLNPKVKPSKIVERDGMKEETFQIIGMSCGHCIEKIEKVLERFGISGQVKIGSVTFKYDENRLSKDELKDAIEDSGYDIA